MFPGFHAGFAGLPPTIADYFSSVMDLLRGVSAPSEVSEEPVARVLAPEYGTLQAAIGFHDGSELHVFLTVDYGDGYPAWPHYSFHYQDDIGSCIFRFDNQRSHPSLAFFPHHVHLGVEEVPYGCPEPSVRYIREAVDSALRGVLDLRF